MAEGIGDFLSDEPLPVNEPEATVEPEVQTEAEPVAAERPRGPDGKFISKEETGVETPTAEAAEPVPPTEPANQLPPAEYAALKDERRKRQEAEARAAAIEAHYAAQARQQQAQPQQPPVDFWDDPQSFMDARMSQLGQTLLQQWEQRENAKRLDQSERAARTKYADYQEAFDAFSQAVQSNPQLAYELAQSDDPGEFAYSRGKTALTLTQVGSLDALKAQLRAEWEAEVRSAAPIPRPALPSTTAVDGSVASRGQPQWAGPPAIGDLLR